MNAPTGAEYVPDEVDLRRDHEALLASGTFGIDCPAVIDEPSLRTAIRYADGHPKARSFAIKHAVRLGLGHLLPGWPEVTVTAVNVSRVSARLTASGALVHQRTGTLVGAQPPNRRQRRGLAEARARLLAAINKAPADPAERRTLVQAAQRLDRLRWIPDGWPAPAAPLAPGAAQALREAAYGRPPQPPQTESQRRRADARNGGMP